MENNELKTVPLNDIHKQLGGKMVPFAGYLMPVRYSSDIEEHNCVRQGVGIFDVSHMGEFLISGNDALDLVQKLVSNDAAQLHDGKVMYAYLPNEQGGIVDDLLVYRLRADAYYLVVNASNIEKDWHWIQSHNTADVKIENLSDNTCLFAVQGPKALATMQKLTDLDLGAMPYYTFQTGTIAGINPVMISTTGYTGAGGFELYVANEHALSLWQAIFEAGKAYDIKPIGLGARDTLRLEMGYCLYGNDINDSSSPIEAGLGWVSKFNKKFINADNIQKQKEMGVSQKLVGIEMIDRGIPRSHYEICDIAGNKIGEVSSGTMSPTLQKGIAMGYIQKPYTSTGSIVYVKIRDKLLQAMVVKMPFV